MRLSPDLAAAPILPPGNDGSDTVSFAWPSSACGFFAEGRTVYGRSRARHRTRGGFGAWRHALALLACLAAAPSPLARASEPSLGLGEPATPQELARFFAIPPDGAGLPDGKGSVADGQKIFAEKCAMCHGDKLQGVKATGGLPLAGGRGSLKLVPPKKTVESYWPYATTLFDYVKRAMPFNAPGSLKDDEVYALCAYILAQGHVVSDQTVLDKASLPKVAMPNRNGFTPYRGPNPRFFP